MKRNGFKERFIAIIEKFRQKGAISSEKAMTLEELGLPPRFKYFMDKRFGQLGIFIEVNGKYYLSEERLKQIEEQRIIRDTSRDSRKKLLTLRIVRIITVILFITILLINFFFESFEIRIVSIIFLVILLAISILQFYFLLRVRRTQF